MFTATKMVITQSIFTVHTCYTYHWKFYKVFKFLFCENYSFWDMLKNALIGWLLKLPERIKYLWNIKKSVKLCWKGLNSKRIENTQVFYKFFFLKLNFKILLIL